MEYFILQLQVCEVNLIHPSKFWSYPMGMTRIPVSSVLCCIMYYTVSYASGMCLPCPHAVYFYIFTIWRIVINYLGILNSPYPLFLYFIPNPKYRPITEFVTDFSLVTKRIFLECLVENSEELRVFGIGRIV